MHNPESALDNETHKILWDFDIETVHKSQARILDLELINKKVWHCYLFGFAVPVDHRMEMKGRKEIDK